MEQAGKNLVKNLVGDEFQFAIAELACHFNIGVFPANSQFFRTMWAIAVIGLFDECWIRQIDQEAAVAMLAAHHFTNVF